MIDQYQVTSGSEGLEFQTNPDVISQIPGFAWTRAFSLVIRLSEVDLYKRGGSTGSIDARLDALAWGIKEGDKLAAPAIQVDHLRNGFNGGRWIFLSAELAPEFYSTRQATDLIRALAESAMQGSQSANEICCLNRKSTRLNSSPTSISYAVFSFKKQNTPHPTQS